MKKVLNGVLFLLVLFAAGQATAAPPWEQMKLQRINSPPLWGSAIQCTAMNFSNREIEVATIIDDTVPGNAGSVVLGPGQSFGAAFTDALISVGYCAFEWVGLPGEVMASACSEKELFSVYGGS